LAKTARVVLLVVAAVVGTDLLRSCVAEPYTVASTSMEPEFHDGDRLVVNKLAYRMGDVKRGDIVVIDTSRVPDATTQLGKTLVKRVVGVPGDVVEGVDGRVQVNGEQLDEPWLDEADTATFGPVEVPEDSLFVLGDNRAASVDSRTFGAVPVDAVIGRVDAIIWPPGNAGRP
jgi:signal peptidase I